MEIGFLHRITILIILLTLAALQAAAQSQPKPIEDKVARSQSQGSSVVVDEGAQARLSLQTQLSSKLSEVGDQVTAVLYEPVLDKDGRVALPRGTEFIGRVTQAQPARRPQKEATITIVFDKMRLAYGEEKISTVVTAIDDFANDEKMKSKNGEGKVGGGHSGGRTARNAGTGATLGGLGGLIIGAAGGGLGGAAASAGAGALAGVLMTKGNDIKLAAGTILRIRFERPVNVPVVEKDNSSPEQYGLGLNLVKTIINAHGGGVSVQSAQGRGSSFTLTLPAIARTAARPAPAHSFLDTSVTS